MADVRIDTEARTESVRFEDQASAVATPAAGFSSIYVRETGTAHGGVYVRKSTGEDIGPLITGVAASAGGGNVTFFGEYADRPAPSTGTYNDGDLFFPTDSFYIERATGTSGPWASFGPVFPLIPPNNNDFAWINQGGASLITNKGSITLVGDGTSNNWRIRKKAAPSPPYTIDVAFLLTAYMTAGQTSGGGILFRQSGDGKLAAFYFRPNDVATGVQIQVDKWTNPTTFSAAYVTRFGRESTLFLGSHLFFRIEDNGVNRICSYSSDGQNWVAIHIVGRTDFLTADEVGFGSSPFGGTDINYLNILSWKEG